VLNARLHRLPVSFDAHHPTARQVAAMTAMRSAQQVPVDWRRVAVSQT